MEFSCIRVLSRRCAQADHTPPSRHTVARRLYDAVGGFAPIPLMEDVDLVRRLGRRRLMPIGAAILASARRYRSAGYLRRPLRNLFCLSLYFAGVPPRRIARLYG